MTCSKCQGLMVLQWFYGENERMQGIQCLNCSKTIWINHSPALATQRQTLRGKWVRIKLKGR